MGNFNLRVYSLVLILVLSGSTFADSEERAERNNEVEKANSKQASDDSASVKELLGSYSGEDIMDAVIRYNKTAKKDEKIVCKKDKVFGLHRSGLVCRTVSTDAAIEGKMSDKDMDKIIAAYNEMMEDRKKVVCRREAKVGTRIARRVCRTKGQMVKDEKKAKDLLDLLDRKKIPRKN